MKYEFNIDKNELLFKERGISFPDIIEAILENGVMLNIDHPNQEKYHNQKMLVVNVNNYAYCVPYVLKDNSFFLKKIYPSRKFQYLIKGASK